MPDRIARSLIAVIAAAAAFAQVRVPTEFEVASVRLNTRNDRIVTINVGPGGRFAVRGYTLGLLIQQAFGVMDWNISGGPGMDPHGSLRCCRDGHCSGEPHGAAVETNAPGIAH